MSKVTLSQLVNLTNQTTAVTTINNNTNTIQTAFDNTISRDGTQPNQMNSNLDMNSFHILNLPEPSSDEDPIRKIDLTNVSTITNLIHTASSTSITIGTGNQTFTVPSQLGFQIGQYVLIQQNGNTANYMSGRVVSYTGTTLVVNVTTTGGSGTISNWTIDVSGAPGATGSQGPQGLPGTPVNVYDTRTIAIAASIPNTTNMIRTLAYDSSYTPESGATFTRLAAGTPFTDTWPTAGTIVGGASYTNGTYYGVALSGSATGFGLIATITVSGGAVTVVDYTYQPGNAYKVGDVLTCANTSIGGTGTGFTYTVSAVSTPLASFVNTTDSSLWQYIPDKGCTHVNQFGAKPDYLGTDSTSTNNFVAIQTALFFGTRESPSVNVYLGLGGYQGDTVKLGVGAYRILYPSTPVMLSVPEGVYLTGVSAGASIIKIDNTWDAATHCISIGNSNGHFAQFNCGLRDMQIYFPRNIACAAGTFAVYSNSVQDTEAVKSVNFFSGQRGCLKYEVGYGGASFVSFKDIGFNSDGGTAQFDCNVGTTLVNCYNWSMGAPSSGENTTAYAINLHGNGGMYDFQNIHMEGFLQGGVQINLVSGNNPQCSFKNVTGGLNIPWVFTLVATNSPGNASFERCQKNNGLATGLIQNGQSGGLSRTADILPKDGIVFFNP